MGIAEVNFTINNLNVRKNSLEEKKSQVENIIDDLQKNINNYFNSNKDDFKEFYKSINKLGFTWDWEGNTVEEFEEVLKNEILNNYNNQNAYYTDIQLKLSSKVEEINNSIIQVNNQLSYWKSLRESLLDN